MLTILLRLCLRFQQQLQKKLTRRVLRLQQLPHQRRPYARYQNASSSLDAGVLGCQKLWYPDLRSRLNLSPQPLEHALIFLSSHLLFQKSKDLSNQIKHIFQLRLSLHLRRQGRIFLWHSIYRNPCSLLAELRSPQKQQGISSSPLQELTN